MSATARDFRGQEKRHRRTVGHLPAVAQEPATLPPGVPCQVPEIHRIQDLRRTAEKFRKFRGHDTQFRGEFRGNSGDMIRNSPELRIMSPEFGGHRAEVPGIVGIPGTFGTSDGGWGEA